MYATEDSLTLLDSFAHIGNKVQCVSWLERLSSKIITDEALEIINRECLKAVNQFYFTSAGKPQSIENKDDITTKFCFIRLPLNDRLSGRGLWLSLVKRSFAWTGAFVGEFRFVSKEAMTKFGTASKELIEPEIEKEYLDNYLGLLDKCDKYDNADTVYEDTDTEDTDTENEVVYSTDDEKVTGSIIQKPVKDTTRKSKKERKKERQKELAAKSMATTKKRGTPIKASDRATRKAEELANRGIDIEAQRAEHKIKATLQNMIASVSWLVEDSANDFSVTDNYFTEELGRNFETIRQILATNDDIAEDLKETAQNLVTFYDKYVAYRAEKAVKTKDDDKKNEINETTADTKNKKAKSATKKAEKEKAEVKVEVESNVQTDAADISISTDMWDLDDLEFGMDTKTYQTDSSKSFFDTLASMCLLQSDAMTNTHYLRSHLYIITTRILAQAKAKARGISKYVRFSVDETMMYFNLGLLNTFAQPIYMVMKVSRGNKVWSAFSPHIVVNKSELVGFGFKQKDITADLERIPLYNSEKELVFKGTEAEFDFSNDRLTHCVVERNQRFPIKYRSYTTEALSKDVIEAVRFALKVQKFDMHYIKPIYECRTNSISFVIPYYVGGDYHTDPPMGIVIVKRDGFWQLATLITREMMMADVSAMFPYSMAWGKVE